MYLTHLLPKLEDTAVSVKKAALKAMRKDSSLVTHNDAVLSRLTKLVNTFAEETTVQIQAFILIGDAGKLSVFNHLSPLLSKCPPPKKKNKEKRKEKKKEKKTK